MEVIYNAKKNLVSLIYTILGIEILFYSVYREFKVTYSIAIAIMTILLFAFYDIVKEAREKGPIKYIPFAFVFILLAYVLINTGRMGSQYSFVQWLSYGGRNLEDNIVYTLGALLIITFVFSSMSYYFTIVKIRMPVLLLLFFIVMISYIKGPYAQGNIAIYAFIMSFVFYFIEHTKHSGKVNKIKINIKAKDISILGSVFILIMLVIGLITPMFNFPNISGLNGTKSYFQNYTFGDSKGFSTESNTSRNISESVTPSPDKVLYTIKAKENPVYLITHNFDVYGNEKWIQNNEAFLYDDSNNIFNQNMIIDKTKDSLELIDKNKFKSTLNTQEIAQFQNVINAGESQNEASIIIEPEYSDSDQLIHPSKINSITQVLGNGRSYLDNYDEIFKTNGNKFNVGREYKLTYYKDNPTSESKEAQIMTFFNDETYSNFSKISKSNVNLSRINTTYTQLGKDTSSRIFTLSENLTKDKNSTYDKAKAIEDYFKSGEYEYNLTLPENKGNGDYIDYFIFEGKKGYCVQYATAMTLLCRASKIPARYVEGYVIEEDKDKVSEGEYQIKASRGHAFVEVYIPGFGFKIFDPTPGIVEDEKVAEKSDPKTTKSDNINKKIIIILDILIPLAIVISLIVVISLKITKRSRNLKKILKCPKEEALEGIINDTIKLFAKIDVIPEKGETPLNFAIRVDRRINIGFAKNLESYYNYKYAMKNISERELEKAILVNEIAFEYVKQKKKARHLRKFNIKN